MTRLARARCAYYGLAFLALAYVATVQALYGTWWGATAFGAASLAPVVSWWMEGEHSLNQHRAAHVMYHLASDLARYQEHELSSDLNSACCEAWWTSLGEDHDTVCEHHTGRRAA